MDRKLSRIYVHLSPRINYIGVQPKLCIYIVYLYTGYNRNYIIWSVVDKVLNREVLFHQGWHQVCVVDKVLIRGVLFHQGWHQVCVVDKVLIIWVLSHQG